MQIHRETADLVMKGNMRGGQFGFKLTPETFEMFFKNIYKNPILACVRELSCNARDSHVMNGNPDKSFDVHVPNLLEPWFEVRDYGVGLSMQQMESLYSTFFESSKQATNDLIGGLGIGSKSPLAYTSMFTAVSYFNGIKYTYIITKDKFGVPTWNFVGEEKTKQANGLAVNIPVNNSSARDMSAFREAIQRTFAYMDVKPNFLGGDLTIVEPKYSVKHTTWGLRENNPVGLDNLVAVMGSITYPIDFSSLRLDKSDEALYEGILYESHRYGNPIFSNIDLFFDIGSLSITPSREELQYDERTVNTIISKFKDVQAEFIKKSQATIDAAPTYYHACVAYAKFSSSARKVLDNNNVKYKGTLELDVSHTVEEHIPNINVLVDEIDPATSLPTGKKIFYKQQTFTLHNVDFSDIAQRRFASKQYPLKTGSYVSGYFEMLATAPVILVKDERCSDIIPKFLGKALSFKGDGYRKCYGISFNSGVTTRVDMDKCINEVLAKINFTRSDIEVLYLSDLVADPLLLLVKGQSKTANVTYKFKSINIKEVLGVTAKPSNHAVISVYNSLNTNYVEKDDTINAKKEKGVVYVIKPQGYRGGVRVLRRLNTSDKELHFLLLMLDIEKIVFVPPQRMNTNIKTNWLTVDEFLTSKKTEIEQLLTSLNQHSLVNSKMCFEFLQGNGLVGVANQYQFFQDIGVGHPALTEVATWYNTIDATLTNTNINSVMSFIEHIMLSTLFNNGAGLAASKLDFDRFYTDTQATSTITDFIKTKSLFLNFLSDDSRNIHRASRYTSQRNQWQEVLNKILG